MKKIFLAVVALAAMTACSNDEFVSVDRAPINFGNAFVDNATRATDPTYGAVPLTSFNVYGTVTGAGNTVVLFDGDNVNGTVGGEWSYVDENTKQEYWVVGAAYNFAAVVDATAAPENAMPSTLTAQANATSHLKDALYATASVASATANQDPVEFTFQHLLSKVQFTVTSNAAGDYSHSIKGIKVSNFETGTYTIADGTWAGATAKDVEFGAVEEVTSTSGAKTNATQMLLIPTTESFNVKFTVEVYRKNGADKTLVSTETKTVTVTGKPLVKGNAYNFTIACSLNKPIQFSVTNNPTWDDEDPITIQ